MYTFVPLLSYLSTGASTKSSRQELLARTPQSRSYLSNQNPSAVQSPTGGEVAIHHFAESGVMELVEIILKIGVFGSFSEILRFIRNGTIVVSELPNIYKDDKASNKLQ